jgi:hypothetical protein
MRERTSSITASVWLAAALVVIGLTGVRQAADAGQRAVREGSSYARTSWGDPDLQGIWTSGPMIDVPFERPAEMGTRATLTDEEFARRVASSERQREAVQATAAASGRRLPPSGPPDWNEAGSPSRQASLIVDPPNGRLPPLTSDGAARASRWQRAAASPAGPEDLNPYDRCITRGVLGSAFPNIYSSASQILQVPGHVVIHHEMIHETRIVPLDGRPHVPDGVRLYVGDPRGHWAGQSLVIETTNFNGLTGSYARNGNGNPTTKRLRLVERYTRTSAQTMQYEVTVEDPDTFTAPWTVAFPLALEPAYRMFEYACHEGNYALANILRGARIAERTGSDGR